MCMYVCMYVCVYLYMYVCVCLYIGGGEFNQLYLMA